mmetsp:Transcript_51808/g.150670  ORF Transcript_51808/g.150670 Transcript_51808/m.150670 type:complete len:406 (-) Transcript_51808:349-1566(-)
MMHSLLVCLRKNSIVSKCCKSGLNSLGCDFSRSTRASALLRNSSPELPLRSTNRKQTSRSGKSKGPKFGQVTTRLIINLWTGLEWSIVRSCHVSRTWHIRSVACGQLLHRSIFVSCASLRARKSLWQRRVSSVFDVGRCSTSLRTSLNVTSTPFHACSRSRAKFTTAWTTAPPSPSTPTDLSHLASSLSSAPMSPPSMASCSGGRLLKTHLTCSACSLWAVSSSVAAPSLRIKSRSALFFISTAKRHWFWASVSSSASRAASSAWCSSSRRWSSRSFSQTWRSRSRASSASSSVSLAASSAAFSAINRWYSSSFSWTKRSRSCATSASRCAKSSSFSAIRISQLCWSSFAFSASSRSLAFNSSSFDFTRLSYCCRSCFESFACSSCAFRRASASSSSARRSDAIA